MALTLALNSLHKPFTPKGSKLGLALAKQLVVALRKAAAILYNGPRLGGDRRVGVNEAERPDVAQPMAVARLIECDAEFPYSFAIGDIVLIRPRHRLGRHPAGRGRWGGEGSGVVDVGPVEGVSDLGVRQFNGAPIAAADRCADGLDATAVVRRRDGVAVPALGGRAGVGHD